MPRGTSLWNFSRGDFFLVWKKRKKYSIPDDESLGFFWELRVAINEPSIDWQFYRSREKNFFFSLERDLCKSFAHIIIIYTQYMISICTNHLHTLVSFTRCVYFFFNLYKSFTHINIIIYTQYRFLICTNHAIHWNHWNHLFTHTM